MRYRARLCWELTKAVGRGVWRVVVSVLVVAGFVAVVLLALWVVDRYEFLGLLAVLLVIATAVSVAHEVGEVWRYR